MKRLLAVFLCTAMIMSCMPAAVFAEVQPREELLFVNGENILAAQDYTVQCGKGAAVYSPGEKTLTLDNAEITETKSGYSGSGIFMQGVNADTEWKLILKGENNITLNDTGEKGIYTVEKLSIYGGGSLDISIPSSYAAHGIFGYRGVSITDVELNIFFRNGNQMGAGIYSDAYISCNNLKGTIDGASTGINSAGDNIEVKGKSSLVMKNVGFGITGNNVLVDNSNIMVNSTKEDYNGIQVQNGSIDILNDSNIQVESQFPSLWAETGINIDQSTVITKTSKDCASIYVNNGDFTAENSRIEGTSFGSVIYVMGEGKIDNSVMDLKSDNYLGMYAAGISIGGASTNIKIESKHRGIYCDDDLLVDDGILSVVSSDWEGLRVNGELSIKGGNVYAKGGKTAVTVHRPTTHTDLTTEPTDPAAKISIDDKLVDVNGARTAATDWIKAKDGTGDYWISYASFLPSNINKLNDNLDNAAKEVHIMKSSSPSVPSDSLAYERYKAVQEIEKYVDKQDYDAEGQKEIAGIADAAKKAIYGASAKAGIDQAVAEAKAELDQVPTIKQKEEAARIERIKKGVNDTTIRAWSISSKGQIKIKWKKSFGFKVDYFEVFRSQKKNSGYGTKPFFTTKEGTKCYYINTKQLKKGKRYYYRLRGVRAIEGEKYYTKWSNKAIRTAQ